ncbi:MAG TPA: hypothetical protein VKT81_06870 [Bryobacteraceae bacterium]|nr:hypothetical protein [Bryobacteraceae bacterium]
MKRRRVVIPLSVLGWLAMAAAGIGEDAGPRTVFQVRYIAAGAVYIDGGRQAGLAEGFHVTIKRKQPGQSEMEARVLGEAVIVSVASTSAVCEIKSKEGDLEVGDLAYLSPQDADVVRMLATSHDSHKYAQVVSFTEGDPLDEEARKYVPRPPLPEINRLRGMVAVEFTVTDDHGPAAASSSQEGVVFRADMTRINGSYWNFTGFYRARLTTFGGKTSPTLMDLINRTYTIGLYYNNPESNYVMGAGRLYLPWATSLDTIDGAYIARKLTKHTLAGVFAGTTPDPTAWNYDPNRQIAGAFLNWDYGNFDSVHYTTTAGFALSRINWRPERQFAFFETSLMFKRGFSLYHDLEANQFYRDPYTGKTQGGGIGRSFLTLRYQPVHLISFELNHNYFQSIPTFDTRLIATGLLQKYLFQGFSAGVRLELPQRVSLYADLGKSRSDGDSQSSLNQMFGVSWANILGTGLQADVRSTRFNSSFGKGTYQMISLSRSMTERLRIEAEVGRQDFQSTFTQAGRSWFGTCTLDWFFLTHYWMGAGWTLYRGGSMNYDQTFINIGYRF